MTFKASIAEVGIAILTHIADWRLATLNNYGPLPPFEKPAEMGRTAPGVSQWLARNGNRLSFRRYPTSDVRLYPEGIHP